MCSKRPRKLHFHAVLLAIALLAPRFCHFYRIRSPLAFRNPNGVSRPRGDRNPTNAILILKKTCASTLEGRTYSLIEMVTRLAERLGVTPRCHRRGQTTGGALVPRWRRRSVSERTGRFPIHPGTTFLGAVKCTASRITRTAWAIYRPFWKGGRWPAAGRGFARIAN